MTATEKAEPTPIKIALTVLHGDRDHQRRAGNHQHEGTSRPMSAPSIRTDGRGHGRHRAR